MAFLQWRRFTFFDRDTLIDHNDEVHKILKDLNITCTSSGRGQVVLGDSEGNVHVLTRPVDTLRTFRAFGIICTHLHQIVQRPYLITAGADETPTDPLIKVWNTEKYDLQERETPLCTRVIRANVGLSIPTPITALDVLDNLTLMAVGYADGHLTLFRGDITREKHSKQKILADCSKHAITGLAFRDGKQSTFNSSDTNIALPVSIPGTSTNASQASLVSGQSRQTILFVSTSQEIISYNLTVKDREQKTLIDTIGCQPNCSCLMTEVRSASLGEHLFVIGRRDAVYFYQSDDRGQCLAFEGEKVMLYWYRSYLVILSRDNRTAGSMPGSSSSSSLAAISRNAIQLDNPNPSPSGLLPNTTMLITIYDIKNKFIAYSSTLPGQASIVDIFSEWGSLYLLTSDGTIIHLRERDAQTKLDILFKRNQFGLAIDVARSHQYDESGLADIFKQYGDFLYRKADYDSSIQQYIRTIGQLEASYVIRKFLDAQRIQNLTTYLEALHRRGLVTGDHTTLLLNCYTKLKDVDKLDIFIQSNDVTFEVETAIRVLRHAGLTDQAVYLARKHSQHSLYFKIQLEDKSNAAAVVDYTLQDMNGDRQLISTYLKKYGRQLMAAQPDRTTEIITHLCLAESWPPGRSGSSAASPTLVEDLTPALEAAEDDPSSIAIHPDEFLHTFFNHHEQLIQFLERIISERPQLATRHVYSRLVDLYLKSWKRECRAGPHGGETDLAAVRHDRILELISNPPEGKLDTNQLLISCSLAEFTDGLLALYEKLKLYRLITSHYMKCANHSKLLEACERFGEEEPSLWIEALHYFGGTDDERSIKRVIDEIEKRKLLPPVRVVEILSKHDNTTLGVVQEYLLRSFSAAQEDIDANGRLIDQYRRDTARIQQETTRMRTNAHEFKSSICSACNQTLELPTVHFLCGHGYHQPCFESYSMVDSSLSADGGDECPLCAPEHHRILSMIKGNRQAGRSSGSAPTAGSPANASGEISDRELYRQFKEDLLTATDPYAVISSYFGRPGVLDDLFEGLSLFGRRDGESSNQSTDQAQPQPANGTAQMRKSPTSPTDSPNIISAAEQLKRESNYFS